MMVRISFAGLLLFAGVLRGEDAARLSIPELLRPESRMHAFQQYALAADPQEAAKSHWANDREFAQSHRDLQVHEICRAGEKDRYLVTWIGIQGTESDWSDIDEARMAANPGVRPMAPRDCRYLYRYFSADGLPLSKEITLLAPAVIASLKGDGTWELVEEEHGYHNRELDLSYLQVRSIEADSKPTFAILYNTHPSNRAANNTWGYQVVPLKNGAGCEIQLGPIAAPQGVIPRVRFRWDQEHKMWVGPKPKAGDHFRVLSSGDPEKETERIANNGGLGYKLAPEPVVDPKFADLTGDFTAHLTLPASASRPYRYQSLAGVSHDQLFAWITGGRSSSAYTQDRMRAATAVPDFWRLDSQSAAVEYVRHNRPPQAESRELLSIFNPGRAVAPEEGDVTLSGGPSGDFAPEGVYLHCLHCSKAGSYFLSAKAIRDRSYCSLSHEPWGFDMRKEEIPYETARHMLQTIWWMGHVRSRPVNGSDSSGEYSGFSSTADGFATVRVAARGEGFSVEGILAAPFGNRFLGVGAMDGSFDKSAFINLTVQLLDCEFPEHLGAPWRSLAMHGYENSADAGPKSYSPDELARVKSIVGDLLQLFRQGEFDGYIASDLVKIATEYGWRDMEIGKIGSVIPAPSDNEKRLKAIERKIDEWKEKLGAGAEESAFRQRDQRQNPSLGIPGLLPVDGKDAAPPSPGDPALIPGLSPADDKRAVPPSPEDAKFREVDELYRERDRIQVELPLGEGAFGYLREYLPKAIRELELFDQPEALDQWARRERGEAQFAVTRLTRLDLPRALDLLRYYEKTESNEFIRGTYGVDRVMLEDKIESKDTTGETAESQTKKLLSESDRIAQLAILLDPKANEFDREIAYALLVPPDDPKRYPDPSIDDALRQLLRGDTNSFRLFAVSRDLEQRIGSSAWPDLVAYWQASPQVPSSVSIVPILTRIAQREPNLYRAKLRDLLAPELKTSYGGLNAVLWSIWQLDLRELEPDLQRLATSGPEDYEGSEGEGGSNHKTPIKDRFHLARVILALWQEKDPLTQARMLVAFALRDAADLSDKNSGAMETLRHQLSATRDLLTDSQKNELSDFVEWCAKNAGDKHHAVPESAVKSVLESLRTVVGNAAEGQK